MTSYPTLSSRKRAFFPLYHAERVAAKQRGEGSFSPPIPPGAHNGRMDIHDIRTLIEREGFPEDTRVTVLAEAAGRVFRVTGGGVGGRGVGFGLSGEGVGLSGAGPGARAPARVGRGGAPRR